MPSSDDARPTLASNVTGAALVLEGGGMRGSLTAGVVTTLLDAGLHLDHVSGISAGSSHVCNYVSRDPERARRTFVDFVDDPRFGGLGTFLRGQGMFNARYIYEETSLPDQALPFDWATFRANPATWAISAVRADTGEQVWWGKEDVPALGDLLVRVRASSTMPIIMPTTMIDGVPYLDGALGATGGIPLDAAEAAGHDRFLIVLSQPRDYVKPAERARRVQLYRRYFRRYPAVADAIVERPARYNETRERIWELERQGKAVVFAPDVMPVTNGERRRDRLQAAYDLGVAQARRELPRWREFLGSPS